MSKFIGRRIVPKHDGVWDINKEYEELSIVLDKASGESYISRRPVPVGTAISDEIYWMQYSLYSAQIAEAVKEMEDTEARLIQYVDTAESNMNSRVNSAESLTNSNKAELNSRMDTLDKRLDANVSASTDKDKDYAAEVVDARVDEEGTKYGSVGSHIRAIGSGKGILKGAVNGSRLSFLDITPELVWTADKYISRKYGGLDNFSQGSNVYFATLDYIPFPYGGCWLQVYSAMSTVESDKSGIAFYDANKKFISGSDYNRETKKLAFRRIFCPDAEKVYEEQVVRAFRKAVLERFRLTLKPIHDNVAVADIMSGRFKEQYDNFTPEADSFVSQMLARLESIQKLDFMERDRAFYKKQIAAAHTSVESTSKKIRLLKSQVDVMQTRLELLGDEMIDPASIEEKKKLIEKLECDIQKDTDTEQKLTEQLDYMEDYWEELEGDYERREKAIEWMKNLPAGRDGTVAFLNEVTEEHCKAFLLSITIHSPLKFTVHWFDDTKTEVEMDSNIEDYRNTASYYDGHTMRDGSQRKRHVR